MSATFAGKCEQQVIVEEIFNRFRKIFYRARQHAPASGVGRILVLGGRIEAPRGRGAESAEGGGVWPPGEGSGRGLCPLPRKFLID